MQLLSIRIADDKYRANHRANHHANHLRDSEGDTLLYISPMSLFPHNLSLIFFTSWGMGPVPLPKRQTEACCIERDRRSRIVEYFIEIDVTTAREAGTDSLRDQPPNDWFQGENFLTTCNCLPIHGSSRLNGRIIEIELNLIQVV